MKPLVSRLALVSLAVGLLSALGCGITQNPSYFPHLLPAGRVIPTHAKPPGAGYFANFDPHAVRLEVRPLKDANNQDVTNPVRTQHVLIATVYDEKNQARRSRRVEWMLEGVGNIIEVDESGFFPGRGFKTGTKHGVSYTDYFEHRLSRGNQNPNDDFIIRPGQTWCVLSSAVEGDSHLTVYAPGINDWEKSKIFVTIRWVDAQWEFPLPASVRAGSQHTFTTRVWRHTDKQPLANYQVRYRILDGPAATFLPSQTQETVVKTDISGNAHVSIAQIAPVFGVNRVGIEIIRPPDPTAPAGSGIVIARGETTIEWQAPALSLTQAAPPTAVLGQEFKVNTTISNPGRIELKAMTVTTQISDGIEYIRSEPPAFKDGKQLTWTLGRLPPGQAHAIQTTYRALRAGSVTICAAVEDPENGLKDEKCATTVIGTPTLKVSIVGPQTGMVGQPLTYQVTTANPGSGTADNVLLTAQFDPALEHETKANPLSLPLGPIAGGDSRSVPLVLTPRQPGNLKIQVAATATGGVSDQAEITVVVQQPQINITIDGPKKVFKDKAAEWTLQVNNPGDVPLTNVILRDRLPPELQYVGATPQGQVVANEIVWNLGTLVPRETKTIRLSARALALAPAAMQVAVVSADGGLRKEAQATVEILGAPGVNHEMRDTRDPVEVGKRTSYVIVLSNKGGTVAENQIVVRAIVPAELKVIQAKGPSAENVAAQIVTFAPVDVAPGQVLEFTIECEALQKGDVRFRVEFSSPTRQPPTFEEESTRIID